MHSIAALTLLLAAVAPADQAKTKDAAERAADAPDKVICKRFAKTGSLIGNERVCKTKADWQRDREELRTTVRSTGCQTTTPSGVC
ncbi:hypothetical protein K7957_14390 [Sphingomonas yunnanensis]|uniref:hypothetical protein n=1 Tax=Sphingomonas yunnanensis TaxID=310400 RepID=UPI001CA6A3BA|nr:hypothetical protein [Sphingomonas yunnanensis]MBY9064127.1 hypothetical protein [Sphingomonas yunnanensis]